MLAKVIWAVTILFTAATTPAPDALREEDFGAAGSYLLTDEHGLSLWQETNGFGGLQTRAFWIGSTRVAPDTLVLH